MTTATIATAINDIFGSCNVVGGMDNILYISDIPTYDLLYEFPNGSNNNFREPIFNLLKNKLLIIKLLYIQE